MGGDAGHLVGRAQIHVTSGALTPVNSGTLTVVFGAATTVQVETAVNGSGSVVAAQNVTAGNSLTAYADYRDVNGKFCGEHGSDVVAGRSDRRCSGW